MLFIKEELNHLPIIEAADVGCGAGRYDLALFQSLGKKINLRCVDANPQMLKQLNALLKQHGVKKFRIIKSLARKMPLKSGSLDAIFTFNAIHHFKLSEFLKECARIVKPGGYVFIYSRLRSQNRRIIWGRFFPLFNKKETRLYELNELRQFIKKTPVLELQSLELFKYKKIASLNKLIEQAIHHHYSTFYLYNKREFEISLEKFKKNINKNFRDTNNVGWYDENILLVLRKKLRKPSASLLRS
jgi:ubiquinone/menaquinone biosynthesis C-methylase UbiE